MTSSVAQRRRAGYAGGLDIGGTKVAVGVATAVGDILERLDPVPSPATDQEATLALLRCIVRSAGRSPTRRRAGSLRRLSVFGRHVRLIVARLSKLGRSRTNGALRGGADQPGILGQHAA